MSTSSAFRFVALRCVALRDSQKAHSDCASVADTQEDTLTLCFKVDIVLHLLKDLVLLNLLLEQRFHAVQKEECECVRPDGTADGGQGGKGNELRTGCPQWSAWSGW